MGEVIVDGVTIWGSVMTNDLLAMSIILISFGALLLAWCVITDIEHISKFQVLGVISSVIAVMAIIVGIWMLGTGFSKKLLVSVNETVMLADFDKNYTIFGKNGNLFIVQEKLKNELDK